MPRFEAEKRRAPFAARVPAALGESRALIVRSDDNRRARLNCISHLLRLIPHKDVPREKLKLPKRSDKGEYDDRATRKGKQFGPENY